MKTRIFKIEKTEAKQISRNHFFCVYFPHLIGGSAEDALCRGFSRQLSD